MPQGVKSLLSALERKYHRARLKLRVPAERIKAKKTKPLAYNVITSNLTT